MAKERGDNYYTIELGQAFIGDQSHVVPEIRSAIITSGLLHIRDA
ncbi:hypothetical protein C823_001051 [Eubacterium plexicaudatum ASF492]|nr:hypothetical protein C823_001051 [Eubacterium plexicaudatum ASF492]